MSRADEGDGARVSRDHDRRPGSPEIPRGQDIGATLAAPALFTVDLLFSLGATGRNRR